MTDKLPRQKGGNGSGPDGTPMEQLLREAMNARAAQVTAHSLRPAEPPSRRVRRLRPVYVAMVPLFGLAAATAFGMLGFKADDTAARERINDPAASVSASPTPQPTTPSPTAASPSPSATAAPSGSAEAEAPLAPPSSSASTTATATTSVATPYTFKKVKFTVPAGWRVVPPKADSSSLCVLSPGAPETATKAEDCSPYGVTLHVFDTEPQTWPTMAALYSNDGWATQPYCPAWGNPHMTTEAGALKVASTVHTWDIVASRAIRKTQWSGTCEGKDSFTAQLWGMQDEQFFISAIGLKAEYQPDLVSILNTLDLSGRPTPVLKANQNDIGLTVEGLATGQQVPNNGTAVTFSVTYKNNSKTNYAQVQALVHTEAYAGTPGEVVAMNAGKLERQDGQTWTEVPLSPGGGMDYAVARPGDTFPLAPGQSRTVKYRMALEKSDGAGVMPVLIAATLPYDATTPQVFLGKTRVPVRVVAK